MNFEQVIMTIFSSGFAKATIALILVNYGVGLIASFTTKTFHLDQLADFTRTMVIPMVGGGLLMNVALWGISGESWVPQEVLQLTGAGVWITIDLALLWRFLRHMKAINPGLVPFNIEPAVNQDTSTTSVMMGTGDGSTGQGGETRVPSVQQ